MQKRFIPFLATCGVLLAVIFYGFKSPSPQKLPIFAPYTSNYQPPVVDTKNYIVHSMYGDFAITEPILQEALVCPAIERLKGLHQGGISWFVSSNDIPYTRYEHSVGVMLLIRKYGGSTLEQLAGLFHDASHTAFSHLADDLFKEATYQDDHHEEILELLGVGKFLKPFGLTVADINHKTGNFLMLEQEITPETCHICADRLEYNLATGLSLGKITAADCTAILNDITYADKNWYFKTPSTAKKFASLPVDFSANFWFSPWSRLTMEWASVAVKRALELKIISLNEFLTSTDAPLFEKIANSPDETIQKYLGYCYRVQTLYEVSDAEHANYTVKSKFRGVDPLINTEQGLKRLTSINEDFFQEYTTTKALLKKGWALALNAKVLLDAPSVRNLVNSIATGAAA